ncbi:MAG: helix-turn-helix domain-containing protein [Betaproteobacteria bacterium]|jgi:predicted XRE-type DNA-binding protein|nr:helix-turn-helix domain-containing protein [Betaproteobacteria bacterium]
MAEFEESSGNVFADLGLPDADEMLIKSRLVAKIAEIIETHGWTQTQAAQIIGLPQPKLSKMLNGQFRGISQAKMLECLARLGRNVQIVIGPETEVGCIDVVFA